MTRRGLSASEFAEYAREQIRTADELLARHRPAGQKLCQCGRPLPCSQAEAVRARKNHYLSQMDMAKDTVALPVVTSPPAPSQSRTLRTLSSKLARRNRRVGRR